MGFTQEPWDYLQLNARIPGKLERGFQRALALMEPQDTICVRDIETAPRFTSRGGVGCLEGEGPAHCSKRELQRRSLFIWRNFRKESEVSSSLSFLSPVEVWASSPWGLSKAASDALLRNHVEGPKSQDRTRGRGNLLHSCHSWQLTDVSWWHWMKVF